MAPRRLQAIAAEALPSGASIAGHYVDGSDASIGQSHYIDGTGGATRVIHSSYADSADSGTASSYADGILHGGHYVDSASTGIHDGQYTDGSSSLSSLGDLVHEGHYGSSSGQILHDGWSTIHPEATSHRVGMMLLVGITRVLLLYLGRCSDDFLQLRSLVSDLVESCNPQLDWAEMTTPLAKAKGPSIT